METISIVSLIVSAIAICISLYFSLHSSLFSRVNKLGDYIAELDKLVISNPELFAIYDNNEIEKNKENTIFINRISAFLYLHFNIFENAFLQLLSKRLAFFKHHKSAWNSFIIKTFKTQYTINFWQCNRELYDKKFVLYVDNLLKQNL